MTDRAVEIAFSLLVIAVTVFLAIVLGKLAVLDEERREVESQKKSYHGHCPICYTTVKEENRK